MHILKSEMEQQKLTKFKQFTSDIVFVWNDTPLGKPRKYFDDWLNQLQMKYDNFNNDFDSKVLTEE